MLYYRNLEITSRTRTPEGFLRAAAVLTRTGRHRFGRSEMVGITDLPNEPNITVDFTGNSVFHDATLSSLRGTPVTLGHPSTGLVTPDSWRDDSRGSVVGEPRKNVQSGTVDGEVLIGDSEAINALETGRQQLSIGYTMELERTPNGKAHYKTHGPIVVNHIALVDRGRSGPRVRIRNQKDPGGDPMEAKDIEKIASGVVQAMLAANAQNLGANAQPGSDALAKLGDKISSAIADQLKPFAAKIDKIEATNKEAADKVAKNAAQAEAKKKADELVKITLANERKRVSVLNRAAQLMTPEQYQQVQNSSVKEILVAACSASVPDAASQSEDYLAGVLSAMNAARSQQGFYPGAPPAAPVAQPMPSAPVMPAYPQVGFTPPAQQVNESDKSYSEYVNQLATAHLHGNPPVGG